MAGSLRDQLLKAGIVDKNKAKKSQHQQRKVNTTNRQAAKSGKKVKTKGQDIQQKILKEQREKQQRDHELNMQRDLERAKKAIHAEVRQIILKNLIEVPKAAEVEYHFTHENKIKKLYITDDQQKQLVKSQLAIVFFDLQYKLIPDRVAEKIEDRIPKLLIRIQPEAKVDENDPYADFQIPDDLKW